MRHPFLAALVLWGLTAPLGGAALRAEPLTITWYDPLLRFAKDERVVYEARQGFRMRGQPRPHPTVPTGPHAKAGPRMGMIDDDAGNEPVEAHGPIWQTVSTESITFVVVDVEPVKREYTLAPIKAKDYAMIKDQASRVFDTVSQLLPGGPVPPFDPHMKKRGLVMSTPPPPGPPAPIEINEKGEFVKRDKMQGKPGELIGEVRFEAQIAGELMYELEPCVQLTGMITRVQNGGISSVEWVELVYSPARGRMLEVIIERDRTRMVYHLKTSQAAPPHHPTQEGVTPWIPPLPDKVRTWLAPEDTAAASPPPSGQDRAALEALRGALPVEPNWYGGILPALRRKAEAQPTGDAALSKLRQALTDGDEGVRGASSAPVTLALSEAERSQRLLAAWSALPPIGVSRWNSSDRFELAPLSLDASSEIRLTVDPQLQDIWLERDHAALALRSSEAVASLIGPPTGVNDSTRWTMEHPEIPHSSLVVHSESLRGSFPAVSITLSLSASSNTLLPEGSDGAQAYVLGVHSVSPGTCHLLLSAWNPVTGAWTFQDRWIGGVNIAPGAIREAVVRTAVDASHATFLMWMSCGLFMCVDARTGDLLWLRTWKPSGSEVPPLLAVSPNVVGYWTSEAHRLTAFDRATGARLWDRPFPADSRWLGLNASAAHVVSDHGCEGLDPRSGERKWVVAVPPTLGALSGQGTVNQDTAVVSYGRSLMLIDSRTGRQSTVATRPDETFCRILSTPNDPQAWWLLTADGLERFEPALR